MQRLENYIILLSTVKVKSVSIIVIFGCFYKYNKVFFILMVCISHAWVLCVNLESYIHIVIIKPWREWKFNKRLWKLHILRNQSVLLFWSIELTVSQFDANYKERQHAISRVWFQISYTYTRGISAYTQFQF